MIDLYNSETNQLLGAVSDRDLQVLVDALEEESSEDRDYYINADTIDLLSANGSPELIEILRGALGSNDGVEIRWSRR
jgi:HEAT repeat protein